MWFLLAGSAGDQTASGRGGTGGHAWMRLEASPQRGDPCDGGADDEAEHKDGAFTKGGRLLTVSPYARNHHRTENRREMRVSIATMASTLSRRHP